VIELAKTIIEKLMSLKAKAPGSLVVLDEQTEINPLIEASVTLISSQPMLVRLKAPLVIGTDIHG